ncbi:MAG TPA: DUF2079 domain-containing protein [Candidatus Limnocylindrales bacterium]|nr:DUF2079 domain-containing protein [Candidatus Limnocylindrales bacterium]
MLKRIEDVRVFIKNNKTYSFVIFFCLLYIFAFSLVALNRYWQYEVFYYDFGIFDKAIWSVSRFKPPIIEHFILGGKWIFADHFNPSIFLLSPLYWLTKSSEIILVAQVVAVGISGLLLFKIGVITTKNNIFSLGVTLSYLLFIGIQNALISDFHEVTVSTAAFAACILAILLNKRYLYFLLLSITLGFKESNFLACGALGMALMLLDKNYRKIGFISSVISLLWGVLAIKFIIPAFSQGVYIYDTPLPTNLISFVGSFINNPIKIKTILISFLSFGFLPIFSPSFYLVIIADFATRFYPPFLTLSWGLGLHYSAMTGIILAVSSIFSHRYLKKYIPEKVFSAYGILLIFSSLFLHRFMLHGPLGLATNKAFYEHTKNFKFLDNLLDKIPPDKTVMTQNNLASHLTHQNVRLLRDKCKPCREEHYRSVMPDYIVIDNRDGQNPNNFYGVSNLEVILKNLQKDKDYKQYYSNGDQYIYKRI